MQLLDLAADLGNPSSAPARVGIAFALLLSLLAGAARGADTTADGAPLSEREIYERDLIARAFSFLGLEPEPEPAGKLVERIEILRLPIIEASDPWPEFVNLFHVVTREHIVRQELLFDEGQPYDEQRVRESARNLRALPLIFSTVRILAARGSAPDRVVVVVVTKDLWSIRLNSNGNFGGGVFNFFYVTPSEQNFLGLNQQVSLHAYVDRAVWALGQIYRVPRLWGSHWALREQLGLRVAHESGEVEGGFGALLLERPLFSLQTRWGFFAEAAFDLGVDRTFQGAALRSVQIQAADTVYQVPELFGYRVFSLRAMGQRSFGEEYKTDLTAGYSLRSRTYALTGGTELLPAAVAEAFREAVLPLDDQYGAMVVGASFYQARYERLQNVQTLGLTEDFRFGPQASLELGWLDPAFGFDQRALRLVFSLGWRGLLWGDILNLQLLGSVAYQPDHLLAAAEDFDWIDRRLEWLLENVSPSLWGVGRLFCRLRGVYGDRSRSHSRELLGGDNTLRGFPSGWLAGPRLFNVNLEFRSRPWVLYTVHLGFVVFYDGGDAYGFTSETDFSYHQSLGVGLRGLVPQFDRLVFRLDIGVPLGADFHTRVLEWVSLAVGQVF